MTTEVIAYKTLWKKVKLLILSNFTFFHNVFLKLFSSFFFNVLKQVYIWRKRLIHLIIFYFSTVTQELEERAKLMKQRIIRQVENSNLPHSDSEGYRYSHESRRDRSRDRGFGRDRLDREYDFRHGRDIDRGYHMRRRKGLPYSYLNLSYTIPTFNPFPNRPWYLCVCSTSLRKTLRGKGEIA